MSYKALPYTYGKRTTTQIDSLTGMSIGDTVFNTTSQLLEIYNGILWIDERSIMFKIDSSASMFIGNTARTLISGEIEEAGTSDKNSFCGIVTRINSGEPTHAAVAFAGKIQALAGENIVSGQSVVLYNNGTINDDDTPGASVMGFCMESVSSGSLAWIALQTIELY